MFCQRTKEFLRSRGVPFEDRDVSTDAAAFDDLSKLGYMTTPVLQINGDTMVGFDQAKIERLLGEG
ncbi:MAG TPA: glutaredoxin family protein [Candidatus Eisenbacteria bacterium]|nr:glutaredoxin family protein [Candidatus Eisenbacteria bacterium]